MQMVVVRQSLVGARASRPRRSARVARWIIVAAWTKHRLIYPPPPATLLSYLRKLAFSAKINHAITVARLTLPCEILRIASLCARSLAASRIAYLQEPSAQQIKRRRISAATTVSIQFTNLRGTTDSTTYTLSSYS